VVAVEVQNSTGAHIFVKAMYPDGLREIKPSAVRGDVLYLDLGDLKRAWDEHLRKYGQGAEPFIVLTIVKDGRIAVQGISLKWKTPYQRVTVVPEYRPLKASQVPAKDASTGNIEPMDSYWEVLEDWEERTIPAVVAEVVNSDYDSWGQISYSYMANAHVGFGVYVFADSDWSRLGTRYTYNVNGGGISHAAFDRGEDAYVWMNFLYRYEKWKIHIDGQNFYEEYVFIKSFDPSSLTWSHYKPSSVRPAPINKWVDDGTYNSNTHSYPYYQFELSDFSTKQFSVDVLGFVSMLSSAGVMSPAAAAAASTADLFIDVNYEYSNIQAFSCTLDIYGEDGTQHRVWKGKAETGVNNINTVPVVGFYVAPG
jgi:hypothetical protein